VSEHQEEFLDLAEESRELARQNREQFEANLQNMWGHSTLGLEAKRAAMAMLSTKTGMYAKIPITCKADTCPYAESCQLLAYGLAPEGEYCPVETAEIELRYEAYSRDFDLDTASFTDKCLVNEIINADIMMERCKALMAREGVPVIDVVAGVSENGDEFTRPEVSKHWEAYERASRKRNEAYSLMKATRKDKKEDDNNRLSITKIISDAVVDPDFLVIEERPEQFKNE
jgi:hypothetical protein